jgi:hypothetical protein
LLSTLVQFGCSRRGKPELSPRAGVSRRRRRRRWA